MWLSDVTIVLDKPAPKSTVIEIVVSRRSSLKTTVEPGAHVYNYKLNPTFKLDADTQVHVKLIHTKPFLSRLITEGLFSNPTADPVCDHKLGYKITLNVVPVHEPLRDLITTCTAFTQQLQSVLDCLGRRKKTVQSAVTLVAAVAELNPIARAAVALVAAVHTHLRDQEKQDQDVKDLAERIRIIFAQTERIKHATGSADGLIWLIAKGETMFRECVDFIIDYCSTPAAVRAFRAATQSKQQNKLDELQRNLRNFAEDFSRELLVFLVDVSAKPSYTADPVLLSPLPPRPARMFGREAEAEDLTSVLLRTSPRAAIIGNGGMGKTTLALWSIHDERVERRYSARLFLTCEGATSVLLLIARLADTLHIPPKARNSRLYETVLQSLRQDRYLLCLDNFETVWEAEACRAESEDFLRQLHAIPSLGLIVTMRGTEHPAPGFPWSRLSPLLPLPFEDATNMFENITRKPADGIVRQLIEAVACIPLALALLATLAQEQSTIGLLRDWHERGTAIVQTSGTNKGTNLDVSILLSVNSARMQKNPFARDVLSMIALLPGGLSGFICDSLVSNASGFDIPGALNTLRYVGLISKEEDTDGIGYHYHMLPPIRRWCSSNLRISTPLKSALYRAYIHLLVVHDDCTLIGDSPIVKTELFNASEVLLHAFEDELEDPHICEAAIKHSRWSVWLGHISDTVIRRAVAHTTGLQKADCLRQLGNFYIYCNELWDAETALTSALMLHQQGEDGHGEGYDSQRLGELYMRRRQYEKATAALESALEFHRREQDASGQGADLQLLGCIYMRRDQLDEAETALKSALDLHRRTENILGQGYDLQCLGDLHMRRDQLDEAEIALSCALELHQRSQAITGAGSVLHRIGQLHMRRNRLDEAEKALVSAVELHHQGQDLHGEGFDFQDLGCLYMREGRLDEAETVLKSAQQLHHRCRDAFGEGSDLQRLGELHMMRQQFSEAEAVLNSALMLHQQEGAVVGAGSDLQRLGELYMRQGRLDEAETALGLALEFHRQGQAALGEGYDLRALGELYTLRHQLDEAETKLKTALKIHQHGQDVIGAASDLHYLGELYIRGGRFEEAETALNSALEFHRQGRDALGEAFDLAVLGELYMEQQLQRQLTEAETAFKSALAIFQQGSSTSLGQCDAHHYLAEVYIRDGRIEMATAALRSVLVLHQQNHDAPGENATLSKLEELTASLTSLQVTDIAEG